MKIKSLFIILLAVGISATVYFSKQTKVLAEYSSRTSQESLMSPEGRDYIYHALKSNISTGKIEAQDYIDMKKAVSKYKSKANKSIDYTWTELGPDNFGGRTRAILPVGESTVFAGSVAGGLWKSTNSGNSWNKVETDFRIVGSIGQAVNGDIYVGTGSSFESGNGGNGSSGFIGEGLYYSSDGGDSFTLVEETEPNFMVNNDGWAFINAIAKDPGHDSRVWFAAEEGVGYIENGGSPVLVDNGLGSNVRGQDIEISSDGSTILLSINNAKIKISTDGGQTFVGANEGTDLPSSGGARARVAISPSDPDFLYVMFSNSSGSFGGLWQSTDNGASWNNIVPEGVDYLNITGTQGNYDLALAVHPNEPSMVFLGGLTIWKAGSEIIEEQITTYFGFGSDHVHPDIHEITFSDNGMMYIGCDGGVYGSADFGQSFFVLNNGYNTQTFYNMAQSSDLNGVIGGAQDNGSIYIPGDGSMMSDLSGFPVSGGDGFGCEISLVTEGIGIGIVTSQNGTVRRANVNGNNPPASFYDNNIINQTGLGGDTGEAGPFYTDIALFEDTEDEDSQLTIEVVNPYLYDLFDTDLTDDEPVQIAVETNNKNIEFLYTLADDEIFHYWAEIERPALVTLEPLTQDPTYWWLNPQPLEEIVEVCILDTISSTLDTIIGSITPILYCDTNFVYDTIIDLPDTLIVDTFFVDCITIGFDTTMVTQMSYTTELVCHDEWHYAADVVTDVREHKLISDPYTSLFAVGFSGADGLWVTREALNYNVSPSWMRIVDVIPAQGVKSLTFSHDGDRLYYTVWNFSNTTRNVYEVSNLDQLYNAGPNGYTGGDIDNLNHRVIRNNAGGQITGIACDYNNPGHMVISVGQYGNTGQGKVQETWNADADDVDDIIWEDIWIPSSDASGLSKMPCYSVIIDRMDETGETIVVGTEFGIFATEDGGDNWSHEINDPSSNMTRGIDRTPVFELRQQVVSSKRWWHPENTGAIYAATHGRGMFRSDTNLSGEISVSEIENSSLLNGLEIYPNPTSNTATVTFELFSNEDVLLKIYTIQGELVKTISKDNLKRGKTSIQLDVNTFTQGNYILHLEAGNSSKTGKFMVIK